MNVPSFCPIPSGAPILPRTCSRRIQRISYENWLPLANVVRLNYYTRDIAAFVESSSALLSRLQAAGCKPASTLLGVVELAYPDMLVEIEATAVV